MLAVVNAACLIFFGKVEYEYGKVEYEYGRVEYGWLPNFN